MADEQAGRNGADENDVACDVGGQDAAVLATLRQRAIPGREPRARPEPAWAELAIMVRNRPVLVDLRPETLSERAAGSLQLQAQGARVPW